MYVTERISREPLYETTRSAYHKLAMESELVPDPPCEWGPCKHLQACKTQLLACRTFGRYVSTPRAQVGVWRRDPDDEPSRARYEQIYRKKDVGE